MTNITSKIALVFAVLLTAACAANLKPAPSATAVSGMEEAARSSVEGVTIIAQADEWPGPADISREVTPLKIRIENNSGVPLRVRYNEFALIGTNRHFSALPLKQIEGEVSEYTGGTYFGPPGFVHRGFAVSPYYSPYYPDVDPYRGDFGPDPYYGGLYDDYWVDIQLPTPDMWQNAIPEGVIDSGGQVEGWLYFEKIPDDTREVVFRADLVNADSKKEYGEIRIPFVIE